MAAKAGEGREWARILPTVFFGLWCLELISSLAAVPIHKGSAASVAVRAAKRYRCPRCGLWRARQC
jgi:hypothetical protein